MRPPKDADGPRRRPFEAELECRLYITCGRAVSSYTSRLVVVKSIKVSLSRAKIGWRVQMKPFQLASDSCRLRLGSTSGLVPVKARFSTLHVGRCRWPCCPPTIYEKDGRHDPMHHRTLQSVEQAPVHAGLNLIELIHSHHYMICRLLDW
jgi:hypothetical protein